MGSVIPLTTGDRLVVPNADALRQFVICELHDSPWHGHAGVKKTRKGIERLYTWPSLKDDVEQYVRTCPCCQRNKPTNQKPAGLLQPLPVPTRKWGSVSMDLITALPETTSMAEFAINNAWQESVQETPFMLTYGQHPLILLSLQTYSHVPAAVEFTENMQYGPERAVQCLECAQQRQKAYADKGRLDVTYDVGEQHLLNTKNVRWKYPDGTRKLMPRWMGPCKGVRNSWSCCLPP